MWSSHVEVTIALFKASATILLGMRMTSSIWGS